MDGKKEKLRLNYMAIGSLPHTDVDSAMKVVEENFSQIPFWPQLAKFNKNEDMIFQFLGNLPGLVIDNINEKIYLENESEEFFTQLEELFMDYEEIASDLTSDLLEKYEISSSNSSTVRPFLNIVKNIKPEFAKGQIVGPFTLATTLTDKEGRCVYYDETLREVVVKTLALKALWQIGEIKRACPETTPIIFIDEPSISQLGTSAFITISQDEVIGIIKEISDLIKSNGAMSAIHCCGKCDWLIPLKAGVDILNLDGYFFAQNLSLFHQQIDEFLKIGGIIAWGVVPTLDKDALAAANLDVMVSKFDEAVDYLVKKGVDKDLILNQSMVTPSCGAGSLSIEMAQKAMSLTKELSNQLSERYKI